MKKFAPLIGAAMLVFGIAAGSQAADMQTAAAPMKVADTSSSADAPKATHKHKTKKSKKAKKTASAAT